MLHTPVAETFERRAARAELLARSSGEPEALRFAAGLYRAQAGVAAGLQAAEGAEGLSGTLEQDLPVLAEWLEAVVRYCGKQGPAALRATVAVHRSHAPGSPGAAALLDWWRTSRSGRASYLARALLRPYAETLASRGVTPEPMDPSRTSRWGHRGCSSCGGLAWIGWRGAGGGRSDDEAPARYLGCGLCGREQPLARIACAACGEADPDQLAVFATEQHPAVRLEGCDRCQRYVKSIDLTVDSLALPEVDDLTSLSMDLWAAEQGYQRLEPSLAGV
jgi:hypothetical protein